MKIQLLLQICSVPMVILLGVLAITISAIALVIRLKAAQAKLLDALIPFCWTPLFLAVVFSLDRFISSINLQLNADESELLDAGIVLSMGLVPLLFGAVMSVIPYLVTSLCRWSLAWSASGLRLLPERAEDSDSEESLDAAEWERKETEDYLEKLVRPR